MSGIGLAIFTVVVLVSFGTWLSVHSIGPANIGLLPAHSRQRARWMFGHARVIQLACALVAVAAIGMQLSSATR